MHGRKQEVYQKDLPSQFEKQKKRYLCKSNHQVLRVKKDLKRKRGRSLLEVRIDEAIGGSSGNVSMEENLRILRVP